MDSIMRFADSVKSQEIPLSVLDTQGSFSNIPFVFFYENTTGSSDFMPKDVLHRSFYRAMEYFPILAGRVKSKGRGNIKIVVDRNNINMPEYVEDASSVHFSEVKLKQFAWHAWPEDVATAGPCPKADRDGEIKLVNVHVVRLKDNSGVIIYISIPHYAVDGEAHMEVVKRWTTICQMMVDGKEDDINKLPTYTFDRSQAFATLPEARIPIDKVTRRIFTKAGVLSEWLAWISPKLRGRIQSKIVKRQKAQPHLFHFSQKTFELLKTELKEHVPESCNITISHILLALVTETLVQAHAAVASRKSKNFLKYIKPRAKKDTLPMGIIFQTREQLKLASTEYIGNVLMPKIVLKPLCEMESSTTIESLAKGIIGFSKTVSAISAPLVASYMDMIGSRPSSFTRPAMNFSFHKTAMTFVYDVMPDMYVADFGYGRPVWVSPIEPFRANAVLLLTGSNPNDGVDIFLSTFSEAMDEILKNESWMSIVSKIY